MAKDFKNHSRIIQGLMRIDNLSTAHLYDLIKFDLEHGIDTFDTADEYGNGRSERKLGEVLKAHPELREQMFIQSKCGIVNDIQGTYYDLSYEHIIKSVHESLKRCHLDYFDCYLLHRPDIMMEVDEIVKAMKELQEEGLVKNFGVSNFSYSAMEYLMAAGVNIVTNQMQLGLGHLNLVREVLNVNMNNKEGTQHAGDLFFMMKQNNIELQCWSPYLYGYFEGVIFQNKAMDDMNGLLEIISMKKKASKCGIATAFLLKLGKNVSVVTGSINKIHILESLSGLEVDLTKQEWYQLYCSTGNLLP